VSDGIKTQRLECY